MKLKAFDPLNATLRGVLVLMTNTSEYQINGGEFFKHHENKNDSES